MKVLFLARSTLYTVYGGDTVQIEATAKYLRQMGVEVDIKLAHEEIDYRPYDLLQVFNVIRPADALKHVRKSRKPYVLSTIFVDFSEYQRMHASGIMGLLSRTLPGDTMEYLKAIARWLKNGEAIRSPEYLLLGHKRAVRKLVRGAAMLLPNSGNEYKRFAAAYGVERPYHVVYNGIDTEVFRLETPPAEAEKDSREVICVARIEGKKNQLNLIKALNNTPFQVKLIGKPAPNHIAYYEECRRIAADNISFIDFVPQQQLMQYYRTAKVHVLASWNETCGLSSLEAGYAACNIVITDKGDTEEYYGNNAWYCDPGDPASIRKAVEEAARAPVSLALREQVISTYNWKESAASTWHAYLKAGFK